MECIDEPITRRLVPELERMDFLPYYFGRSFMLQGEAKVYQWMRALSKDYDGGFWEFYTLSNGGGYMAPDSGFLHLFVPGNGFTGDLSADAAGIVANLFCLGQMSAETPESSWFCERYHWLRDYALSHDESQLILSAID